MELHSYAKRRTARKWTTEQKWKLVRCRVIYDHWFNNKPSVSGVPWKKILAVAELDDYTVCFARKQWSNVLAKYKQLKESRLAETNTTIIDDEMIDKLTEEWEFFGFIHSYMTRKTADLHSYALTIPPEDDDKGSNKTESDNTNDQTDDTERYGKRRKSDHSGDDQQPTTAIGNDAKEDFIKEDISSNIGMLVCASNERIHELGDDIYDKRNYKRFVHKPYSPKLQRNTDHDFYSKRSCEECGMDDCICKQKKNPPDFGIYIAMPMKIYRPAPALRMPVKQENAVISYRRQPIPEIQRVDPSYLHVPQYSILPNQNNLNNQRAIGATPSSSSRQSLQNGQVSALSERDKYYRHKRNFYQQLGKRIDSVLQVCSQIIKVEYPNIDVTPLTNLNGNQSAGEQSVDTDSPESNAQN